MSFVLSLEAKLESLRKRENVNERKRISEIYIFSVKAVSITLLFDHHKQGRTLISSSFIP